MVPVPPTRKRLITLSPFILPGQSSEGRKPFYVNLSAQNQSFKFKQLHLLLRTPAARENVVQYWREKIFNALTLFFLVIGTIILIPTVLAAFEKGYWGVIVLELAAYLTVLCIFLMQQVFFGIRTWAFFLILYLLGAGVEIMLGPYGSGLICLFMIPILAAILHGLRSAVLTIVLNTLAFIAMGILLGQNLLTDSKLMIYDLAGWAIVSINFTCVSTVITLSVAMIVHRIELGLLREKEVMAQKHAETEKLRKVNAELDRFVYSASHDLRAPLTSLQGLINIYHLEKSEPQREEILKMMGQRVDKMNGFISQIIDYSWNSRVEVYSEEVDFHSLITGVLDNLQFDEGYKETNVQTVIQGAASFYSDEKRIWLIINNLLSNCFKYRNPYSRSSVWIEIEKMDAEVRIRVKDNGLGIREQHLPHVTKMFYRATEKNVGSGLGLFIVKETADTLQGRIGITSEVNQGNTVKLTLPNLALTSIAGD